MLVSRQSSDISRLPTVGCSYVLPLASHKTTLLFGQCQIILLGDKGTCVNILPIVMKVELLGDEPQATQLQV